MSVLTPELREALARVGVSSLTGGLTRRGLRSMCLYNLWPIRAGQPRLIGIGCTMRFIPLARGQGRARQQVLDGPAAGDGGMARR